MDSASVLWNLEQVSLRGRQSPRLEPMTLQIRTGCTAVIGYSGAGKTSLLNLLVGFEKPDGGAIVSRPREQEGRTMARGQGESPVLATGTVALQPDNLLVGTDKEAGASRASAFPSRSLGTREKGVFWAPQNGGLWPHLTVREHFSIIRGGALPSDLLQNFDLAHKLDSRPDELSEGEQSRLSVARALWTRAPVLVMDEPLVHVDPARADVCWRAIRRHLSASGASLVFSTHSPEVVLGEAERALCLRAGRLLYDGTVDDLYARPPSAELAGFLGPTNWFEADESRWWLGREEGVARSWRPEQMAVVPVAAGAFTVRAVRFMGSVEEVGLRCEATGQERRFYHRPASKRLQVGGFATISLRM